MRGRYRPPSEEELRAQLADSQSRLADLEQRGNEACSAYDLRMGYDAEFNMQLVRNHIAYYMKQLAPYDAAPQQQSFLDLIEDTSE